METKSILLVEDDELDVISVERALVKIEYDVKLYTAFNGKEALSLLSGDNPIPKPDFILLDVNMPKMNGLEFMRALRQNRSFDDVKVFVMTTSNEDQDRNELYNLGVSGYILKPLNFTDNTKKSSSMDNFMRFQILKILNNEHQS